MATLDQLREAQIPFQERRFQYNDRVRSSSQGNDIALDNSLEGMETAFDDTFVDGGFNQSQMDLAYNFDLNSDPVLCEMSSTWNTDAAFRNEVGLFGQFLTTSDETQQIENAWNLVVSGSESGLSGATGTSSLSSLSSSLDNSTPAFGHLPDTEQMFATDQFPLQRFMRSMKQEQTQTPPRMFISPAECTKITASKSLFELANEAAKERTLFKQIESDEESTSTSASARNPRSPSSFPPRPLSRGGKSKPKSKIKSKSSFPSSPPSDQPHRRSHEAGINRKTGKPTLVGTYPPLMTGSIFQCPHPWCQQSSNNKWSTKNGYKYHLKWVCPRNPKSTRSLRLAAGEVMKKGKGERTGFEARCEECGGVFKSENGYKLHKTRNNGTKEGKCASRRKKIEEQQKVDAQGTQQYPAPNFQCQDFQMMHDQSVPQEAKTNAEIGSTMEDFVEYLHFE